MLFRSVSRDLVAKDLKHGKGHKFGHKKHHGDNDDVVEVSTGAAPTITAYTYAVINVDTGLITPIQPGVVTITALDIATGATGQIDVTLTPIEFVGTWTCGPTGAPTDPSDLSKGGVGGKDQTVTFTLTPGVLNSGEFTSSCTNWNGDISSNPGTWTAIDGTVSYDMGGTCVATYTFTDDHTAVCKIADGIPSPLAGTTITFTKN